MTNDEFRNEAAKSLAEYLDIAQQLKKFNKNVRQFDFESLDPEAWEDFKTVTKASDALCDYVIACVIVGSRVTESDEVLDAMFKEFQD